MNRIATIRMDGSVSDYEYFDSSSANDSTILPPNLEPQGHILCQHQMNDVSLASSFDEMLLRGIRWMFVEYYRTPLAFTFLALYTFLALSVGGLGGFLLARCCYRRPQQQGPSWDSWSSMTSQKRITDEHHYHSPKTTTATTNTNTTNTQPQPHLPQHIAIVMDGNRRYGTKHHCNGHAAGAKQVGNVLEWTLEMPFVKELSLFCFSTQNWERDPHEINYLFQTLLQDYLEKQLYETVIQRNIKVLVHSTDFQRIPIPVQEQLNHLVQSTAHFGTKVHPQINLQLNLCISYGGREEILNACQRLLEEEPKHTVITEEDFVAKLSIQSNPDLLIRTAGDVRLSNFLLWQTSYTELCFMEEPWPEVSRERYRSVILEDFPQRQRRFGK